MIAALKKNKELRENWGCYDCEKFVIESEIFVITN